MPSGPADEPVEIDVTKNLLWALADESNRLVIQFFEDTDRDDVALEELAGYVADHHGGILRDSPAKVESRLHHKSLPQLAEQELITYDDATMVVRNRTDRVLPPDLEEHVLSLDDGT